MSIHDLPEPETTIFCDRVILSQRNQVIHITMEQIPAVIEQLEADYIHLEMSEQALKSQ